MEKKIEIGKRKIGSGEPCFIIAEAGVNHNGDIDLALQLVDTAVSAGADCVKFQTFTTELCESKNALKPDYFLARDGGKSKHDLLKKLELSPGQFRELKEYCDAKGIIFLSMAADMKALDILLSIGVEAVKVGSSDTINIPLLRRIGESGLPVILSTGMSSMEDVDISVAALQDNGASEIAILQCTSQYPAPYEELDLNVLNTYSRKYNMPVGLSDHSRGIHIPAAAVAMGASVIEKHLTLSRNLPGVDHMASIESHEFREMVSNIRDIEKALGTGTKRVQPSEKEHLLTMRKSIVASHRLEKGIVIAEEDLLIKRPGGGILPTELKRVIGKKIKEAVQADDLISWDVLE